MKFVKVLRNCRGQVNSIVRLPQWWAILSHQLSGNPANFCVKCDLNYEILIKKILKCLVFFFHKLPSNAVRKFYFKDLCPG